METEILKELSTIRIYVFIIMAGLIIWVAMYLLGGMQRLVENYKKTLDSHFENSMLKMLDLGEYEKVIEECIETLERYPNHVDATWFLAKAYYYTENNQLALEYFDKTLYLVPSWEESINGYVKKLNAR